jgi:hypothetical protein
MSARGKCELHVAGKYEGERPLQKSRYREGSNTFKYNMILNYCRGFRGLNFQIEGKKIKLFIKYEHVIQGVLFDNAVLSTLMSAANRYCIKMFLKMWR